MMDGILCGVFMRSKTLSLACAVIALMLTVHANPVEAGILDKIFGSSEVAYERGYDDGQVRGYNELCHPSASNIIYGDWDNEHYAEGYQDGYADGRRDCQSSR